MKYEGKTVKNTLSPQHIYSYIYVFEIVSLVNLFKEYASVMKEF